jgi:hypothetical protein
MEAHPAYRAVCEWASRGASSAWDQDAVLEWTRCITAAGFAPTAATLGILAFATMSENPREADAMFRGAADVAQADGDRFTESALRQAVCSAQLRFSFPPSDSVEQAQLGLAAARACGSPSAIAFALQGVAKASFLVERDVALAAIDELPSVVSQCAFLDTYVQHAVEYTWAWLRVADGDRGGLRAFRAEISAHAATEQPGMLTVQLSRLAHALVHLDVRLDTAAELLSGVRAHRMNVTPWSEESADILRERMGDGRYDAAAKRGAALTVAQLAARATATIDELLTHA